MLMQYFQNRALGCLPCFWVLHETNSQFLLSSSSMPYPSSPQSFIGDLLCAGLQDWFFSPVFSQLMHAVRKVVLTLLRRKRAYLKPTYQLVDYPIYSVIIAGTKVIFHCANP